MRYRQIGFFFASCLLISAAMADVLQLKEGHPESYVVQKGDTLWDISGHFLKSPWLWPRLWQVNPQVKDPHWIYPGDVLSLVWVNGEPRLTQKHTIKLSPSIRVEPKISPVPTIKLASISAFLRSDHIFPAGSKLDAMPYLLGNNLNDRSASEKQRLFVKGQLVEGQQYGLYRPGPIYKDKASGEVLGQRAILAGIVTAGVAHPDNITEVLLTKNVREVLQGDRVLPLPDQEQLDAYFTLQPAKLASMGEIIDTDNSTSVAGKFEVVMLNKGTQDGIKSGDVFTILRPGVEVTGNNADNLAYKLVSTEGQKLLASNGQRLPEEQIGEAMAFKIYDRVSLALILKASDTVRVGFQVGNP
jgi:hypothetical protein